jgi:hypothetical protein
MESVVRLEIYFIFIFYPILMGILVRRKKITLKRVMLLSITLISILFQTLYLYATTLDRTPRKVFILSSDEWITSIALSIGLWLFLFLMTRPFHKD